jgi:adenylosuccinate synthase
VDGLREEGPGAIGTTRRGIGPCYQDRAARRGIRMADLGDAAQFEAKVRANLEAWRSFVEGRGVALPDPREVTETYLAYAEELAPFIGDVSEALEEVRRAGNRTLLEGAQGTMLDLDHGTYPFVTSSSVTAGGACTGAGVPPTAVRRVLGISKAYTTRVGDGPFPTELLGEDGDALRKAGAEFGATTGRPRRCGWLDIPVLRYARRVNGIGDLALTKLDVLTGIDPIRVAVAYEFDGERVETPPSVDLSRVTPVYEDLPGWTEDLTGARTLQDLPKAARAYVDRIEALVECPVTLLSVGPGREQTLEIANPWR